MAFPLTGTPRTASSVKLFIPGEITFLATREWNSAPIQLYSRSAPVLLSCPPSPIVLGQIWPRGKK